jgi:DNA ligase-1
MAPLLQHANLCFCFTGVLSKDRASLEADCLKLGILCNSGVRARTTHVISTAGEVAKNTKKIQDACKQSKPIVTEDFMTECIDAGDVVDYKPFLLTPCMATPQKPSSKSTGASKSSPSKGPANLSNTQGAAEARTVLLAHKYEAEQKGNLDPTGWWMSEKLDGVRAYWSGEAFYSRAGNLFEAPAWFTADLPKDVPLDGELWAGRGQFAMAISICKTKKGNGDMNRWKYLNYSVFDVPNLAIQGKPAPYEARREWLEQNLKTKKYCNYVPGEVCKSKEHMNELLAKVEKAGGEGLMIRKPKSLYERKRSHTLLKVKSFHDEEGILTGYQTGHGKNTGLTGALLLKTPDGRQVKVGTGLTDAERRRPPPKGSVITYKYFEITKDGSPRFPAFVCVRTDIDWDDYCKTYTPPKIHKPKGMKRTHSIMFGAPLGRANSLDLNDVSTSAAPTVSSSASSLGDDNEDTSTPPPSKKVRKAPPSPGASSSAKVSSSSSGNVDDDAALQGALIRSTQVDTVMSDEEDDDILPFHGTISSIQQEFPGGHLLQVVEGDLLKAEAACIVNSTNPQLQHKNGLGKAMAKAAGSSLQEESDEYVKNNGELDESEVAITGSGDMPCSHVIHTVTPHFDSTDPEGSYTALYTCVKECLVAADNMGFESLALPLLGSGIAGFSAETASRAAVTAATDFFIANVDSPVFVVGIVTNEDRVVPKLEAALQKLAKSVPLRKSVTTESDDAEDGDWKPSDSM